MKVITRDGASGVDDAFIELPVLVYRDDPRWIPEDAGAVRLAFSHANDWFASGKAITLCVPGEARLGVFRANDCNIDGAPAAFFGYWEHRGGKANNALFREAKAWARAQGAERLYGPIDFTTHGCYRLLLEAEPGARPFVGEPYNPPSYAALLESLGFTVARRYITQVSTQQPDTGRIVATRQRLLDAGYALAPLDGARWRELLPELKLLADAIFADNFAYTPVSYASFARGYADTVARRLCPRTSLLAYGPEGDIAGFVLVYPDYGPLAVQGAGEERVAACSLTFAEHAPVLERLGERTGILRTIGVAPRHRGRGVSNALGATVLAGGASHYNRWIAPLIRDDNLSRLFGDSQPHSTRHYGLFVGSTNGGDR